MSDHLGVQAILPLAQNVLTGKLRSEAVGEQRWAVALDLRVSEATRELK